MTWQRIDENTYIDDTLVTCAEYQLFIDEMREEGKYYQPDHWTSYQFLKGQAREPILGVRHSDAVTFCGWLTGYHGGEWLFRLPNQEEAEMFPINPAGSLPLGYWLSEHHQFAWVRHLSEYAHNLARSLASIRAANLEIDLAFAFKPNPISARKLTSDITSDRALSLARDRDIDCARDLDRASKLSITISTSARDLSYEIDLARDRSRDRHRAYKRALSLARDLDGEFARARARVHDRNREMDSNLSSAIGVYTELFVLNERIAGRSPAFEGIRLVKERIR